MTKTQLFKKILTEAYYYVLAYFKSYLFPSIIETFNETKEEILKILWNSLKPKLQEQLEVAIQEANSFFNSANYELKETIIIDYLFDNIKLPILLRPSKFLIKKILRKKVREFISEKLQKLESINVLA